MASNPLQDPRTTVEHYPTWTITEIAEIYRYSRDHIRKIVDAGFVESHKVNFRNQTVILVHTHSMNEYVIRQMKRRAS